MNKIAFTQSLFPLLSFLISFHLLPFHFFCKRKLHPVAWHREKNRALQKEESTQKFFGETTKRTMREKRQWQKNKLKLRRGVSIWAKRLSKLFYKEMTEPSLKTSLETMRNETCCRQRTHWKNKNSTDCIKEDNFLRVFIDFLHFKLYMIYIEV